MCKTKRTLVSIETGVWWVLGTRPGGLYYSRDRPDDVVGLEDATTFATEDGAREALVLAKKPPTVPSNQRLHVIRVSRTTRESCEG